jgi:hypothetical protein
MESAASYQPLLLVSGLVFLATAGYLIANLGAVVALFGRRGPQHGDLQADTQGRRSQASRGAVIAALALHAIAIAGLALVAFAATRDTTDTAPGREGLPAEMEPVPDR